MYVPRLRTNIFNILKTFSILYFLGRYGSYRRKRERSRKLAKTLVERVLHQVLSFRIEANAHSTVAKSRSTHVFMQISYEKFVAGCVEHRNVRVTSAGEIIAAVPVLQTPDLCQSILPFFCPS